MFSIGPHVFSSKVLLAPMAGITDAPYRKLCLEQGAGLAYAEMVHADIGLYQSNKTRTRLVFDDSESVRAVQIVGYDAKMLADAAAFQEDLGANIIDINMGCPAKKVCSRAAGSALLGSPELVQSILSAVVNRVKVPVTLKIRTGLCPNTRNAEQIAHIATQEGVSALTIHGRTRADRFKGSAEYDTIRSVRDMTNLPLIANGDITSAAKAEEVLERTGADAIMIGRASRGNPWIFKEINRSMASSDGIMPEMGSSGPLADTILEHLDGIHELYGLPQGIKIARKHIGWYFETLGLSPDFRKAFNIIEDPLEQHRFIRALADENRFTGENVYDC